MSYNNEPHLVNATYTFLHINSRKVNPELLDGVVDGETLTLYTKRGRVVCVMAPFGTSDNRYRWNGTHWVRRSTDRDGRSYTDAYRLED